MLKTAHVQRGKIVHAAIYVRKSNVAVQIYGSEFIEPAKQIIQRRKILYFTYIGNITSAITAWDE